MQFGYYLYDKTKDEHLGEIASLVDDPRTLVYFDTNILAYLFKLHPSARREFFAWADQLIAQSRLKIPGWCAGEYFAKVKAGDLKAYTPKSKEVEQLRKELEGMVRSAALFVDATLLTSISYAGDTETFLRGFKAAIDELSKYTPAFKYQFDPGVVHEEIVAHLSSTILKSDLGALCLRASNEGVARISHRLPPAFKDAAKIENQFGDLIIWYEVLSNSASSAQTFQKVLFVSNDEKPDWVYLPTYRKEIVGTRRQSVPNRDSPIRIPDPRLLAEFGNVVGHDNFMIASLPTLIEGLSKIRGADFQDIARAIQVDAVDDTLPATTAVVEISAPTEATSAIAEQPNQLSAAASIAVPTQPSPGPEPEPEPEPVAMGLTYPEEALRDVAFEFDRPTPIHATIRQLKSQNWYVQNPAISQISTYRGTPFTPASWFVLGRNIYQAACGNAQKAMDFLGSLDVQLLKFPQQTADHILAGMLFEIYFDAHGEFRQQPKASWIEKPLSLVATEQFGTVRHFIRAKLEEQHPTLMFAPGDIDSINLTVRTTEAPTIDEDGKSDDDRKRLLISLTFAQLELIRDINPEIDTLWTQLHRQRFDINELVQLISREAVVPRWAIERNFVPGVRVDSIFLIPENRILDLSPVRAAAAVTTGA